MTGESTADEVRLLQEELVRREGELQRIDRQIDRLQHALQSTGFLRGTFIGTAAVLASAFRRKKGLEEALVARRAARSIAVQQLKKTKERLEVAKLQLTDE